MTLYSCDACNYTTDDKSNYVKHNSTTKHIKKVQYSTKLKPNDTTRYSNETKSTLKYICNICQNNYSTASSLARHKKACKENVNPSNTLELEKKNGEIEVLKQCIIGKDDLIKQLREQNKQLLEQNDQLHKQNEKLNSMISNAGSVVKDSVSVANKSLTFLEKNYNNAPKLEQLKDYTFLHSKGKDNLYTTLFSKHQEKKLASYLGDKIVGVYKIDDPNKQSLWNSDASRLNYVIRELLRNNQIIWRVDKGGIKTSKYVIEPMLNYIKQLLNDYCIKNQPLKHFDKSPTFLEKMCVKLKSAEGIINNINNNILSKDILRYIAPQFSIGTNDDNTITYDGVDNDCDMDDENDIDNNDNCDEDDITCNSTLNYAFVDSDIE